MKKCTSLHTLKMTLISSAVALGLSACGGSSSSGGSGTTDTTAPVITLQGTSPTVVQVGTAYTDLGATAEDDIDGTISVTTTGTVDSNNPEKYMLTYSAVDQAGNTATEVTRVVYVSAPSEDGNSVLSVQDGKLVMTVVKQSDPNLEEENSAVYGMDGDEFDHVLTHNNVDLVSIEGDMNLIETQYAGDGRPRIVMYITFVSPSSGNTVSLSMIFEERTSSGVTTRSYINVSGAESSIPAIHKLPQTKGTAVHYKIEVLNDGQNFVKMSVGDQSAIIPLSALPASDMKFLQSYFITKVKNDVSDYSVKTSLDNIVLKYKEDGVLKTETRNFNGFPDGKAPLADDIFNLIFNGS